MSPITHIIKRNGREVAFDPARITNAVFKAALSLRGEDLTRAEEVSGRVVEKLEQSYGEDNPPTVEDIQDTVVDTLREMDHGKTADAYARYREEHVGSSRVDLQACKLEYSIVSPK